MSAVGGGGGAVYPLLPCNGQLSYRRDEARQCVSMTPK